MRNGPSLSVKELTASINQLHKREEVSWPKLSIWTGTDDKVVNAINSTYLANQWAALSGGLELLKLQASEGYEKTVWLYEDKSHIELN